MTALTLVLGGPGCGKTTHLLDVVREHLAAGIAPAQIAFVSFTRAAANEAAERAAKQFGLAEDDLPWFRTIHSLCFARLGASREEVLGPKDWREFGTLVGFSLGAGLVTFMTYILSQDAMTSWGWRIPFLIALPLGIVGLYLRTRMEDTPGFRALENAGEVAEATLQELFRSNWRVRSCAGGS